LNEKQLANKKVYGLGASTKGNVLLQYFNIDKKLIQKIGEVNEDKFGKFTPGSLIPMISEKELLELNPDYIVILPWHFRPFFDELKSLKGKTLVYPLPKFEIVEL
jgi:NDP-4-keto-2,6-dideoxyhexose 3-C-methyltransferase